MNITDIEEKDLTITTFSQLIARQLELIELYRGFDSSLPKEGKLDVNLDQQIIKLKLWNIIEEIGEYYKGHSKMHQKEELIDSLHFALELGLITLFSAEEMERILADVSKCYLCQRITLTELYSGYAYAGNFLKNKTWKKTQRETDISAFKDHLQECFVMHFSYIMSFMGVSEFIELYDRKSLINLFRIRSEY